MSSPQTPRAATPAASLQAAIPVFAFLVANRVAGLRWAVAVATVWSLKLVFDRHRKGLRLGTFMPLLTLAVITRGIVGIVTDSETVYFGLGIATKFALGAALAVSVAIKKPLSARLAPYLLTTTPQVAAHPMYQSTMVAATLIASAYYAASGFFDVWLYRRSSIEGFVLIRFLANWPLAVAALAAVMTVANRRLTLIPGVESAADLVEGRWREYWPAIDIQPPVESSE